MHLIGLSFVLFRREMCYYGFLFLSSKFKPLSNREKEAEEADRSHVTGEDLGSQDKEETL